MTAANPPTGLSPLQQLLEEELYEDDYSLLVWNASTWELIGRVSDMRLVNALLTVSLGRGKEPLCINTNLYPVELLKEEDGYAITVGETTYNILREL